MPRNKGYSDEEIIDAIQQGGIKGRRMTEHIFDKYSGYVVKGSRKFRLSIEDARDAYADAVVAMSQQIFIQSFRAESKISTYLYSIFLNRCKNKVRDLSRKQLDLIDEMPEMPTSAQNMLQELIEQDELNSIRDLLDELGETCKKIIWDREFFGFTFDEIAQRIGFSSVRSVSSKKAACLKRLRALIRQKNQSI